MSCCFADIACQQKMVSMENWFPEKITSRSFNYYSSTVPTNSVKIAAVDVEIIGLT